MTMIHEAIFDMLSYEGDAPNTGSITREEDGTTRIVRIFNNASLILEIRSDLGQCGTWITIQSIDSTIPWESGGRPFFKPLTEALQWLQEWEL